MRGRFSAKVDWALPSSFEAISSALATLVFLCYSSLPLPHLSYFATLVFLCHSCLALLLLSSFASLVFLCYSSAFATLVFLCYSCLPLLLLSPFASILSSFASLLSSFASGCNGLNTLAHISPNKCMQHQTFVNNVANHEDNGLPFATIQMIFEHSSHSWVRESGEPLTRETCSLCLELFKIDGEVQRCLVCTLFMMRQGLGSGLGYDR